MFIGQSQDQKVVVSVPFDLKSSLGGLGIDYGDTLASDQVASALGINSALSPMTPTINISHSDPEIWKMLGGQLQIEIPTTAQLTLTDSQEALACQITKAESASEETGELSDITCTRMDTNSENSFWLASKSSCKTRPSTMGTIGCTATNILLDQNSYTAKSTQASSSLSKTCLEQAVDPSCRTPFTFAALPAQKINDDEFLPSSYINHITSLERNGQKKLWIATTSGFASTPTGTSQWQVLSSRHGLPETYVKELFFVKDCTYLASHYRVYRSCDRLLTWSPIFPTPSYSGSIQGFYVDEGNVLVMTYEHLYRSSNQGESFSKVSLSGTGEMVRLRADGNKLYILRWGTPNQVFVSQNSGASWTAYTITTSNNLTSSLEVFDNKLLTIFQPVGSSAFLSQSSDSGQTWTNAILTGTNELWGLYDSGNYLLLSSDQGLYKTTDRGQNWARVRQAPLGRVYEFDNKLYSYAHEKAEGLYQSNNGGQDWTVVAQSRDEKDMIATSGIAIRDKRIIQASPFGKIGYSEDAGSTWKFSSLSNFTFADINTFKFFGDTLYLVSSQQIFTSNDFGKTWNEATPAAISVSSTDIIMSFSRSGDDLYLVQWKDNLGQTRLWSSHNGGQTWSSSSGSAITSLASAQPSCVHVGDGGEVFVALENWPASTDLSVLYHSTDDGASWSKLSDIKVSESFCKLYSDGARVAYLDVGGGLYLSENKGQSFGAKILDSSIYTEDLIKDLAFVGDKGLTVATHGGLKYSADLGKTWKRYIPKDNGLRSFQLNSVAASGSNLYVRGLGGMSVGRYK